MTTWGLQHINLSLFIICYSYVVDADPLRLVFLFVFLCCPQIKADKSTKKGQLYYVKWIGINNLGSTSEPKEHFVGADAEEKLKEYIHSKEFKAEKAEKRREDILAGKLVVPCKHAEEPAPSQPLSTLPAKKTECAFCRKRQNASDFWGHFNSGPGNKEKFYGTTQRRLLQSDQNM